MKEVPENLQKITEGVEQSLNVVKQEGAQLAPEEQRKAEKTTEDKQPPQAQLKGKEGKKQADSLAQISAELQNLIQEPDDPS